MNRPHQQVYVENIVSGDFDEEKLIELFNSEEYRPYADQIFQLAITQGNKDIHPESILWWQEAVAREQQPEPLPEQDQQLDIELEQEEEKKDGGGIYLVIMTLFLIAYGIKYLMD